MYASHQGSDISTGCPSKLKFPTKWNAFLQNTQAYDEANFGSEMFSNSEDMGESHFMKIWNPHCYLALDDSNQNYVHDTPAQAVPSRQVLLPVVQKMWNIHFLSSWALIVILTLKMATLLHGTTAHKEAPQYHIWLQRG